MSALPQPVMPAVPSPPRATIREATPADVDDLAPRVRDADREEMFASHGFTPHEGLTHSLASSTHAWAGEIDGQLVCLFGVGPLSLLTGKGMPWFIASPEIERHQVMFLRRCIPVVGAMAGMYPMLTNWVDARNDKSIRWLRWLGFELQPAKPFGYLQLPFHKFEMRT